MAQEKRVFTVQTAGGQELKLSVRRPSNKELQSSELHYSKAFNEAIINGIVPQSRLVASLIESGGWSEAKDDAIEAQRQKVILLEAQLSEAKEDIDKQNIAKSLADERDKLYVLRQERNDLIAHTAEARSEEAQRHYIVSRVTEYAGTEKQFWKTFEDFSNEVDGGIVFRCVYEYMTFVNGLDSDFMSQLPENKVLDKMNAEPAPAPAADVKPPEDTVVKPLAEPTPPAK